MMGFGAPEGQGVGESLTAPWGPGSAPVVEVTEIAPCEEERQWVP